MHHSYLAILFASHVVEIRGGTACEFNFTNETLGRYLVKPTQIILYLRNRKDEFLQELWQSSCILSSLLCFGTFFRPIHN